jgi:hypothetical protein
MQTVRIYRLEDLDWRTRWPDRDDLQREIKGAVCAAQPIDPDGLPAVSRQRPGYQAVASDRPAAPLSLPPQTVHDGAVARPGGQPPRQAPDHTYGPGAQVLLVSSA